MKIVSYDEISYCSKVHTIKGTKFTLNKSRDSSVKRLGYGLDDRVSRIRFPAWAGKFSLHRRVRNSSGAHPASYPMGTRGFFPGVKAAGAFS